MFMAGIFSGLFYVDILAAGTFLLQDSRLRNTGRYK